MDTYRRSGIAAGILFIVATAAGVQSLCTLGPVNAAGYLTAIAANEPKALAGALLVFVVGWAGAGIAISMYPVLRKHSEGLALGAVGFRIIEGVFFCIGAVLILLLAGLSRESLMAGSAAMEQYQRLGALLAEARTWARDVAGLLAWCIGATLYYWLYFRTRLVPRWLSLGARRAPPDHGSEPARAVPSAHVDVELAHTHEPSPCASGDGAGGLAHGQGIRPGRRRAAGEGSGMTHRVRVQGELGPEWAEWFGAAAISREDAGATLLACEVADQAALHGLLARLRDLGLPLLSMNYIDPGQAVEPPTDRSIGAGAGDSGGSIHQQTLSCLPDEPCAEERTKMISSISRALGVAFLIQAIASLASGMIMKLGLIVPGDMSETLVKVANRPWLMRTSILGDMIAAAGIIFLGVMLFVVLRKQNEQMALVGLGLLSLEGMLLAASKIAGFACLCIGQEYATAGRPAVLETMGGVALRSMDFGSTLHMVAFGLGALLFYWLLYKSRVIPRALSLWGLVTVPVVLGATVATVFGCDVPFAVYLPYAPFEFVVGAWILIGGLSGKTKTESRGSVLS
jgi:hypothetical protein